MDPVDYSALAKQAGATSSQPAGGAAPIDYAALAKQAGATDSQPAQQPDRMSIGGFLGNTLSSAGKFVGDMAGPLLHPGDTATGLLNLGLGMAEKTGFPAVNGQSHQQNVDALVKMYSDRYGGFGKFRQTLYNDPVGVLSDVAALASAGGGIAKGVELGADALKADAVANAAAKVGKVASTVSDITNPLSLAGKAADVAGLSRVADNFGDWTSQKLRTMALKGGYKINANPTAVVDAARTMGEQGVPLSDTGLQTISQKLAALQQEKQSRLAELAADGATIDPRGIAARLDALKASGAGASQVNPQKDMADIEKVKQNFLAANPGPIPVDRAEALKSGTYANNKYGPNPPPNLAATAKAEKALAGALADELEQEKFPEIGELTAQQAKLINLRGIMEQAVAKHNNAGGFVGTLQKELSPTRIMVSGAALGAGAHYAPEVTAGAGAAAAMAAVLKDPAVQTRLAAAIDWGRANAAKAGKVSATTGNGISRVGAFMDSLQPQQQ